MVNNVRREYFYGPTNRGIYIELPAEDRDSRAAGTNLEN